MNGKRVLVVDDASTVRMYVRSVLQAEGFVVHEAANGLEGIEKCLNEGPFDLYIVDINMPKLDGYGFLRELRSLDIPQSPAIVSSTESEEADKQEAYRCGANFYLTKAVKPDLLVESCKLLLGLK